VVPKMPPITTDVTATQAAPSHPIQDAGIAAAKDLESIYAANGPAAAAAKLQAEYLDAMKTPLPKDSAHLTQMDYEFTRLSVDQGKGDGTLLGCATDWGITMLQGPGAIDQPSLEQMATPYQSGGSTATPPSDAYGQAMAGVLNQNWQALAGFDHATNGMDTPKLTYLDLTESQNVDERIRTYKPAPPKPPSLLDEIEGFFTWS
jgi:hypothetical protein